MLTAHALLPMPVHSTSSHCPISPPLTSVTNLRLCAGVSSQAPSSRSCWWCVPLTTAALRYPGISWLWATNAGFTSERRTAHCTLPLGISGRAKINELVPSGTSVVVFFVNLCVSSHCLGSLTTCSVSPSFAREPLRLHKPSRVIQDDPSCDSIMGHRHLRGERFGVIYSKRRSICEPERWCTSSPHSDKF